MNIVDKEILVIELEEHLNQVHCCAGKNPFIYVTNDNILQATLNEYNDRVSTSNVNLDHIDSVPFDLCARDKRYGKITGIIGTDYLRGLA